MDITHKATLENSIIDNVRRANNLLASSRNTNTADQNYTIA